MIKLKELKVVENAFFRSRLKFDKVTLYPLLHRKFSGTDLFGEKSFDKFDVSGFCSLSYSPAKTRLLQDDLQEIRKNISENDFVFDDVFWNDDNLEKVHEQISRLLCLEFQPKNVIFCDNFPEKYKLYENTRVGAITSFGNNGDCGVYYLKCRVDNTSSAINLIHEQIHCCLFQNKGDNKIFIEWFEEGIALFFSLAIYYELTKDIFTLKAYRERCHIFSKQIKGLDFTKRPFEYMRIMSKIFLHGGFELIGNLLDKYLEDDKEYIDSILGRVMADDLPMNYVPDGLIENFLASFTSVVEPERISPTEFVVFEALSKPKDIDRLVCDLNMSSNIVKKAVKCLMNKRICFLNADKKLEIIDHQKDLFDNGLIKACFSIKE